MLPFYKLLWPCQGANPCSPADFAIAMEKPVISENIKEAAKELGINDIAMCLLIMLGAEQ
jgi:hypothetical protein